MRGAFWWIDRWRKSTAYNDMTLAEQGAYRNLLDELWLRDGVLPTTDRVLAKISGDAVEWPNVRDAVLARFKKTKKGYRNLTHDKIMKESKRRAKNQKAYRDRQRAANEGDNVTANVDRSPYSDPLLKERGADAAHAQKGAASNGYDYATLGSRRVRRRQGGGTTEVEYAPNDWRPLLSIDSGADIEAIWSES